MRGPLAVRSLVSLGVMAVTGLALARLCLSCTGGNSPCAAVSCIHNRVPVDRSKASTMKPTSAQPSSRGW